MFRNKYSYFFTVRSCQPHAQPLRWRTTVVGSPWLLIQFSQLPFISGGRLLHPQPEDAPCRGNKGPTVERQDGTKLYFYEGDKECLQSFDPKPSRKYNIFETWKSMELWHPWSVAHDIKSWWNFRHRYLGTAVADQNYIIPFTIAYLRPK
jgi:hypothetical protein